MSFSDSAVRLAGLAAALLGWPPATFWTATPAELAAVLNGLAPQSDTAGADDLARLKEMYPDG